MGAEGVQGLYAGMSGSLIGVASTNCAYFYWYSIVRAFTSATSKTAHPSTVVDALLGAAAGALAQLLTIPVAATTTRQQTQKKEGGGKGIVDTAREVIDGEDGVRSVERLEGELGPGREPGHHIRAYERLKDMLFPGKTSLKPWRPSPSAPCPRPWPPS